MRPSTVRPTFALLLWLALAAVSAAQAQAGAKPVGATAGTAATPAGEPLCELTAPGYDSRQVACSLPPTGDKARRYRLRIDFAGGHDDTMARFNRTLVDGAPLVCEAPSKTELLGEDGNVSIDCRFRRTAGRAQAAALVAVFQWSHAQYVDYSLVELDELEKPHGDAAAR